MNATCTANRRSKLTARFRPSRVAKPGELIVGRQQILNDLDKVVEKALRRKLLKLVSTPTATSYLLSAINSLYSPS